MFGIGRVTVTQEGFTVAWAFRTERFVWDDVEEVCGTLTFGYETFYIVLNGDKALDLCFDFGKTALISAFSLRLPGFPRDWFSRIRDNAPDDYSLLWKREQVTAPQDAGGMPAAYQELMKVLDPYASERVLDRNRASVPGVRFPDAEAMERGGRILKYAGMAILALALVGYWEIVTKVRLANHSNATLVNAEIALDHGGPTLWAGNLAPGQSVWIWEMASGGKVALSYNQDGKKIQYFLGHAGAPAPFNGSTLVSVYDNGGIGMSKIPSLGTAVSYVADKVMP